MVISCCIILLLRYVFTHSIQEAENEKNKIHNYLNTSDAHYPLTYEEYNDLKSFYLEHENENTSITSNSNQDNTGHNPINHQMKFSEYEDISSDSDAAPESSNPEIIHNYSVSFTNKLQTKDNSNDNENSSVKTKNENSLSGNIIITNFKNPNEVKSTDIYQLILKFISTFVYLERPLANLGYLLSYDIPVLNKDKKISKDQLENRLISLVDNLILFNKKNKNPNFDSLKSIKQNFDTLREYYSKKKNPENLTINNYLESKSSNSIKHKKYLEAGEYVKICEELQYITNSKHIFNLNIASLCVFFPLYF